MVFHYLGLTTAYHSEVLAQYYWGPLNGTTRFWVKATRREFPPFLGYVVFSMETSPLNPKESGIRKFRFCHQSSGGLTVQLKPSGN